MRQHELSAFIKLGAAIRYLLEVKFEVKAGEAVPFWDRHVIPNVDTVLKLINELDLQAARESGQYQQLGELRGQFAEASKQSSTINQIQADNLNEVIGKVRQRVYANAEQKAAYCLDKNQDAPDITNRWPQTITMGVLGQIPAKHVWSAVLFVFVVFGVGITIGSIGIVEWIITVLQIIVARLKSYSG
jgi:hypothetical protein